MPPRPPAQLGPTSIVPEPTDENQSLKAAMRKLWADHVIWTRQYIVAAVAGAPDAEAAAARLLRNQEDIGNAVVPFYGAEAGAGLTDLLKSHILIAVDLIDAARAGDKRRFARHDRRWDRNADEIAAFLAGANPNWPEQDVRDLDRKSTRLNSSHANSSYAVFCLKKKNMLPGGFGCKVFGRRVAQCFAMSRKGTTSCRGRVLRTAHAPRSPLSNS